MSCRACGGVPLKARGLCEKHYRAHHYRQNRDKVKAQGAAWYASNKGRKRVTRRAYYQNNIESALAGSAARYSANRKAILARQRERRVTNPEAFRAVWKSWAERNPDRRRAAVRKYQAQKLRATPAWADDFFIGEVYHLAELRTKLLGVPHEVDHIVPLQSDIVCGLHVEHNLQVIPRMANIQKSNATWPGMP